jgi:lauroyl/myristoyl acyltransferase
MSDPAPAAPAPPPPKQRRGLGRRIADRFAAGLVVVAGTLACWLPGWPLWRVADLAGAISYRVSPSRRARARRNLGRVVGWMAANQKGEERYWRAASDGRALEALVRAAFKHHARYYVEVARAPRLNSHFIDERVVVETPDEVAEAFARTGPLILVAAHFGPIELPGFYGAHRLGKLISPMETIANPGIQRYLVRTRSTLGVQLLTLKEAAPEMLAALRRGDPVGIVGDRELAGAGIDVRLFGAAARIPAGPVLLAVQTGAPIYVCGVRRTSPGRYRGNLRRLAEPAGLTRRERIKAMAQAEADLFEQVIVDAPEQWMAIFHPIWPDLEEASWSKAAARAEASAEEPSGGR